MATAVNRIVKGYLLKRGFSVVSDDTYSHIEEWLDWYQNDVEKFHRYSVYNGVVMTKQERYKLGMSKTVSEDWANLLLNEKVAIHAGKYDARLTEILRANNFQTRANQLLELSFALGTGAFVEYKNADGDVVIDYIRADMIYPLTWDNGDVTECAFGTPKVMDGKKVIYVQIHRFGRGEGENEDEYYIENRYIDQESGKETDAPEDIVEIVSTKSVEPLFQLVTPNICNNIDLDSPLGISIYANALDEVKGCDLIYDSYMNEFVLGRKRIMVPLSQAKRQMEADGVTNPVFDPNDTVYYILPEDRSGENKLTEVDMTIRASDHELGIQRALDLLSFKCGMGAGRYKFEQGGVKTATEVISDKSDLYQNRQKHCIIISAAIINMIRAVSFLDQGGAVDATVDFDDSIIEDSNTIIDKNIKLVGAGLRSKVAAIMEINKCSENEALEELERIREDGQVTGQDIDWTATEDDEDELDTTDDPPEEDEDADDPEGDDGKSDE